MENTTTAAKVTIINCGNGNLVRIWHDDGQVNVQLTDRNQVELGRAQFTGRDAVTMAGGVTDTWIDSNE
jgi:hypothetical protein